MQFILAEVPVRVYPTALELHLAANLPRLVLLFFAIMYQISIDTLGSYLDLYTR